MEVKNGYKQSEIGMIPEDWEAVELSECLKIRHGKDQKQVKSLNGSYPILGTGGILGYTNSFLYDSESVLIGRKGTIDNPFYMDTPFWTVDTLFYTEINKSYSPKYLFYKFQLIDWYSYNEASGVPSLNAKTIEKIKISTPPLPEQQAIAEVLSNNDRLIQALEKQIAKKRKIRQGVMQELLTPKEWWKNEPIKKLASISTGAKNTQDRIEEGAYPFFVRSQNIEKINSYSFDGEAILIAGDGVGTGKVMHYYIGKFDFHQRVYKLSDFEDIINGQYFFLFFKNNFYNRIMQMTAKSSVDSIRREMISEMIISFPPLEEQIHIANLLSDMDNYICALERKLLKYKSLKQGLMQTLLTGKIRLVKS